MVGGDWDIDSRGRGLGDLGDGHLGAGGYGGVDGQFPLGEVVLEVVQHPRVAGLSCPLPPRW